MQVLHWMFSSDRKIQLSDGINSMKTILNSRLQEMVRILAKEKFKEHTLNLLLIKVRLHFRGLLFKIINTISSECCLNILVLWYCFVLAQVIFLIIHLSDTIMFVAAQWSFSWESQIKIDYFENNINIFILNSNFLQERAVHSFVRTTISNEHSVFDE